MEAQLKLTMTQMAQLKRTMTFLRRNVNLYLQNGERVLINSKIVYKYNPAGCSIRSKTGVTHSIAILLVTHMGNVPENEETYKIGTITISYAHWHYEKKGILIWLDHYLNLPMDTHRF